MLDRAPIKSLDRHLSTGMFGSSEYLSANLDVLYQEIGQLISEYVSINVPDISQIDNYRKKSVLRRNLEFVFAELSEGKQPTGLGNLQASVIDCGIDLNANHSQIGPITIFSDYSNDHIAQNIRDAFVFSMKSEGARIFGVRPLNSQIEKAQQALFLTRDILPQTILGTLNLAPNAVLVRGDVSSAYINENPYSFFINSTQFDNLPLIVETIFHEALHEKMTSIRLTSNLLHADYDDFESEEVGDVLVPWPDLTNPRYWSFARALAAYHVYVHTAAYYHEILSCSKTVDGCGIAYRQLFQRGLLQFERAQYLHQSLVHDRCSSYCDVDGEKFIDWTQEALEMIADLYNSPASGFRHPKTWNPDKVREINDKPGA